jgi:phosphatidylserine/phosphatidylglycerophosphate/cardiolipin synthase-like enzyme
MARSPQRASRDTIAAFEAAGSPELVGRACRLQAYRPLPAVTPIATRGPFVAYASPDATFAVTRRILAAASRSILIGIYDLEARYVVDLLKDALSRGVAVTLMLDLDGRSGERPLYDELAAAGATCVPAPSCASRQSRYFSSSHEKILVVDDEWTLVQSGNWSTNSIPRNEVDGGDPAAWVPGNRDMGVAVRSPELAAFFGAVIRGDIDLELNGAGPQAAGGGLADLPAVGAAQAAPRRRPLRTFPSRSFAPEAPVEVMPILSPENYMATIPGLLRSARRSILVEQQYIRGTQPQIRTLLDAIVAARVASPGLTVRIVLAAPFPGARFAKEAAAIRDLAASHDLRLGRDVRILNPRYLAHCHNKLIVVDDQRVLVSSQNWSDLAVTSNREAGLLIPHAPIARYFRAIFNLDWRTGVTRLVARPKEILGPEAAGPTSSIPIAWGDYVEV